MMVRQGDPCNWIGIVVDPGPSVGSAVSIQTCMCVHFGFFGLLPESCDLNLSQHMYTALGQI